MSSAMQAYEATDDHFIRTDYGGPLMPSMHYHGSYELYYLEEGSREYFVEDKFFSVSPGHFVLIPPGKLHRTGGAYAKRTLIGFTWEFLTNTYTEKALPQLLKCFDHVLLHPSEDRQKELRLLLGALAKCSSDTEFSVCLGMLLNALSKCQPASHYNKQISALMEYINKNYNEIDSISQIAEHFYISKGHLCRIFKESMHLTVIDYLNNIKIKKACELLEFTDKNISEISQVCGFNSFSYFGKVFRKLMGTTPKEYRNSTK